MALEQEEPLQTILEDIIHEAYHAPGSSFLETDDSFGPGNLHSLIAKAIREWIGSGGDVLRTERRWKNESPGTIPFKSDKNTLKKYYKITKLHVKLNEEIL